MKKRKTIYRGDLRQYVKLMNTIYGRPFIKFNIRNILSNY